MLNPELGGLEPKLKGNAIVIKSPLSPPDLEKQDQLFSIFGDNVNLEWLNWEGSLPNGAVAIYNSYTQRTDYVCKHNCEAGFYNPGLGPYCRYPYGNREYYAPKFQIRTNNECQAVVKTMTISKSTEMQTTWNVDRATMQSISSSITAHIPYISEFGITMGSMRTLTFSQGTTMVEEINHSVSVELNIQPNHSCSVRMEGHKVKVVIPCTARLSRTYRNGQTRSTNITGTYKSIQIGVVWTVVDRCEPVADAGPCQSQCQA